MKKLRKSIAVLLIVMMAALTGGVLTGCGGSSGEAGEVNIYMWSEYMAPTLAEQFETDPSEITMDTNLIDDLGADSLDVVELIMSLEDTYGITISDEDAANLVTVRKIVDFLESIQ